MQIRVFTAIDVLGIESGW